MALTNLFSPKSVAIVGASTNQGTVGNDIAKNLIEKTFAGSVYPVNPKTSTLFNVPCYKTLANIPDDHIDLALIIVPAAAVPGVLREAGEKNIPAAIIISSGFKETGATGAALESEVQTIANQYGITLLGPNCLGLIRPSLGMNASFANQMPDTGHLAFFSQSGALLTALLDSSIGRFGFSALVSTGNKATVAENELLRFFADDTETTVLGVYAESLTDAEALIDTGRVLIGNPVPKPVIILKAGATEAGTAAASSHTGALAGSDASYDALFRQARFLRVHSFRELLNLLSVFSHNALPAGNRLAIITNAGGMGVLASDTAIENGLVLAPLTPETEAFLRDALPAAANVHNPVDVIGDAKADRYQAALDAVSVDPNVDIILVILTPQSMTEAHTTAEAIIATKKLHPEKPIAAAFVGDQSVAEGVSLLRNKGIAVFSSPEEGAKSLAALSRVTSFRTKTTHTPFVFPDIDQSAARTIIENVRRSGRTQLMETESWGVLKAYGFPFLASGIAHSADEALAIAKKIGRPVALKIISPDILHKTESGGVMLDVLPENTSTAYDELLIRVAAKRPDAKLEGALVVEMAVQGGHEIILGLKHEAPLGTLILFGMGGIYTETFHDISFRFASRLTREDADEMMREIKSFPILDGVRGEQGIDLEKTVEYIGRLARLANDFPDIAELDANPLLTFPDASEFRILDARIILKK